jgi:hypothetical protein
MQDHLIDLLITKEEAKRKAHFFVREKYGTIPSLSTPKMLDDGWHIPIVARYPRVLFDTTTNRPKKVRFMKFDNLGELVVDNKTGEITSKPTYWDLRTGIKDNLEYVKNTVQQALIKAGAKQFSKSPFSEHMHTPIIDIIAYVLMNNKLQISEEIGRLAEIDREKYIAIINTLVKMGLLDWTGDILSPGNMLVQIEGQSDDLPTKLSDSLAFFFAEGYEDIQSIHQVLGPHLTISGFIFQQSIEYDDLTPISTGQIEEVIQLSYRQEVKRIKTPRYLIQLNKVGIIEQKTINHEEVWLPNEEIFYGVKAQDNILAPLKNIFQNSAARV